MAQATHDARPAALTWRKSALAYLLIVVLPMGGGLALLLLNARPVVRPTEASGPQTDLIGVLLVTVPIVLATAHLCGAITHRIGQPRVIGEMIGGVLLGPSVLGAISPAAQHALFPPEIMPILNSLAQLGVIFFMFGVGLEFSTRELRHNGVAAVVIGHAALAVPFGAGILLGLFLPASYQPHGAGRLPYLFFLGLAMSVSALPVLAAILRQQRLMNSPAGTLGIAAAAIGDATIWCLLVVLMVFTGRGGSATVLRTAALTVMFTVVMLAVVRPALRRGLAKAARHDRDRYPLQVVLTLFVLLCALAGQRIGVHPIIGAFLAGIVMPRSSGIVHSFLQRTEGLTLWLLLPLFFASVGLLTDLGTLRGGTALLICGLVFVVAVSGKFAGTMLGARLMGRSRDESLALGVMLNCRGLTELVMLNIGQSLGLIGGTLFSTLVVTTVVTTLAAGPLLGLLYSPAPAEPGGVAADPVPELHR
jgi:Kef-type K+ transport system membrane component KefB